MTDTLPPSRVLLAIPLLLLAACGGARHAPAKSTGLPAGITAQAIATGDSIFSKSGCQRCHGAGAVGAQNGPSLVAGKWLQVDGSFDAIARLVTTGVPKDSIKVSTHPFAMRARGGPANLTDDQVRAVSAYVYTISRKKDPRG
jgi:mono/diheme cytochrome c family protein